MNLKDQVLSIEQVQELQELGFDIEKYTSMAFLNLSSCIPPKYSITNYQREIKSKIEYIPTLTIGDIMEILPKEIKKDDKKYCLYVAYIHGSISISYDIVNGIGNLMLIVTGDLIYGLFETLKWGIKQKHIKLITPEWAKENLCMDDGNDITECYSDEIIDHISWLLCTWEDFDYKDAKEVLNQFHLITKNK